MKIILLLITVCIYSVQAVSIPPMRQVNVTGRLVCLNFTDGYDAVDEGFAEIWEYDSAKFLGVQNYHDFLNSTKLSHTGGFKLHGQETEDLITERMEFFLRIKLPCSIYGPLRYCMDDEFRVQCKGGRDEDKFAEFVNRFEYLEAHQTLFKEDSYNLECWLGYKDPKMGNKKVNGLHCSGGLPSEGHIFHTGKNDDVWDFFDPKYPRH